VCDKHHFEFEIDGAIRTQVIQKLDASPLHPLQEDVAPPGSGIYALYRRNTFVYGGKAMDKTTLRRRLNEHYRKIAGRRNIDVGEMSCRWLEIESPWFVRAAEDAIITPKEGEWQKSGFGSHIPGKGRPGLFAAKWDEEFPPNIAAGVTGIVDLLEE